ncbi:cell division suppressor protein YneA [Metasolibacillus meyeri]|uniref:cell division suppressor protein YneA n=1 Tax=Metasolibacillus meyeri TaxID=1071052 RepID=UPI00187D5C3F|nr:LysM peptidoglycan-binding domain-containing protein [Metasolibacillus meyeri]
MNWLKKNSYIAVFVTFTVFVISVLVITDENIEQYEEIIITHGDTLWSLADQYRGKMSTEQWIGFVKTTNYLPNEKLVSGQQLLVPVEKRSIAAYQMKEGSHSREVANRH